MITIYGCKQEESSEKSLDSFVFKISDNPNLNYDVYGEVEGEKISITFPARTDISQLAASFVFKGAGISVKGIQQKSGVTVNDFRKPVEYTIEAEDKSTKRYITDFTIAPEKEQLLSKFEIKRTYNPQLGEDIVFTINHSTKTLDATYLRWINSTTPSQFVVSFEAGLAEVFVGGVQIQSGLSKVDFRKPVTIETVSGDYPRRLYTANILCPQLNASLPVLRIEADGPISSKDYYVTAKLEINGNGISQGLWSFNNEKIEIRLRGHATMGLPKKPYRIKFPSKYSPLGLNHAKEKKWVLLANDADKSLIRNAIALQVSRILQSDAKYRKFTASTQFVDVYLNGRYEGNYHLTDQVEVAPGRVNVMELTAMDADDASTISGGYLLELDGFATGEPLWFRTPQGMTVTIKSPDSDDYAPAQAAWIRNYITTVENALFSEGFKNPVTGWRKYIDADSWVDYYIVSELTGNPDAWWSTYLSKERGVDFFVIGPVWDFDIAFNNDSRIVNATNRLMADAAHDPKQWIRRFMQDETFKADVKDRWNRKKNELSGLTNYIDELAVLLDMSQKANYTRWDIKTQTLGHANPPPATYQEAITQLKQYIVQRYAILDAEFNRW